jgi:hypothetical protein
MHGLLGGNSNAGVHNGNLCVGDASHQVGFLRGGNIATPEEADLMAGISNAQVSVVNTGVAVTTEQNQ